MSIFELRAHVIGQSRNVACENDGTGLVLHFPEGRRAVRTIREAIRVAGDDIGRFLRYVDNRNKPWGLYVTVGSVSAKYGEDPPGTVSFPVLGPPADPNSLVARIHARYRPGDSPMQALENAQQILRAYLKEDGRSAA
jgi:hypothetical protein